MPHIHELYAIWQQAGSNHRKDQLLAHTLGGVVSEEGQQANVRWPDGHCELLPEYSTDIRHAEEAMAMAWMAMGESSPSRVRCSVEKKSGRGGRECLVEWWFDGGEHVYTPIFYSEAESRAFAAFVFVEQSR